MKINKILKLVLVVLLIPTFLTSCKKNQKIENPKPLGLQYFDYFDTVSIIFNYAGDSEEDMKKKCEATVTILDKYNKLFDIYYEYEGENNLCTVNKKAGIEPVEVDKELIDFLLYCKELYNKTNGYMNVMLGSVLKIWHDARTSATDPTNPVRYVPTKEELEEANKHTSIDLLKIDTTNNTVYISDKNASIDVGAIGKGYATEYAGRYLESINANGYVLNIGGNIKTIGTKPNKEGWVTAIKNPVDVSTFIGKVMLQDISCVTSGDYERYYYCDGVKYHHVIDKDTLFPSTYWSSVTIITKDSGLADALSTTLFCMSYEDGLKVIESFEEDIQVLWVSSDLQTYKTKGLNLVE